jgi:cell pole-organizing protein PopZ
MAQASSAQREPSMEEILSSIRRIIEDSDAGSSKAGNPEATAEARQAEGSEQDVEAGDAPAGQPTAPVKPAAAKSLADIQKELAGEQKKSSGTKAASGDFDKDDGVVELDATDVKSSENEETSGSKTEPRSAGAPISAAKPALESVVQPPKADIRPVAANAPKESKPEAKAAIPSEEVKPEAAAKPGTSPILSPDAGRRVAASFEQLSEAFMETRAKSFDSMAEEMLRPMLQDWLDENLPTLVERLVREEIERVARGGN